MAAFATLSAKPGRVSPDYIIRFNAVAASAMTKMEWVDVSKTRDGKYIILTPSTEPKKGERRSAAHLDRTSGSTRICCNWMVKGEQFLPASWFDNKRHKIKKDKKSNIYICLKEVIDSDGRDGKCAEV